MAPGKGVKHADDPQLVAVLRLDLPTDCVEAFVEHDLG